MRAENCQAMMQWDPNRRHSATKILHHPYFEAASPTAKTGKGYGHGA